jgi:hypothetical protein
MPTSLAVNMSSTHEIKDPSREDIHEQIRSELESTRGSFNVLLDEISVEDLIKPSFNPARNIAEMLYHLSVAPRDLPSDVRLIRHLKWVPKFPAGPFNLVNIYFTQRGARNTTKESLVEANDQAHALTLQALESVQDDEWEIGVDYPDWNPLLGEDVTLERLFHYIKLHFESHASDIRQALGIDSKQYENEGSSG